MTTTRNCLRCNIAFESSGPGNRICLSCNRHNQEKRYMKVHPHPSDIHPIHEPTIPVILEKELNEKEKTDPPSGS